MSVYIHIPFCHYICSYCDFPKVIKSDKFIDYYLNSLEFEIKNNYKGEVIDTLYIGGGTPSTFSIIHLKRLFDILKVFNLSDDAEISFEANSEDLTIEKLEFLKEYVNRLSIGVQTFNSNILKLLNRSLNIVNLENAFKYFNNINLDLMFGFNGQSLDDFKSDLDKIIKLNPTHISAYSLIVEPNTKLYIDRYMIDDDLGREMYDFLCKMLKKNGYNHYEVSNFSKKGFESKHNLVYWNNSEYYGFGLGACGYVNGERCENTRGLTSYLKGNYLREKHAVSKEEDVQNEFILGLRKLSGIDKNLFYKRFGFDIKDFNEVRDLLEKGLLKENEDSVFINPKYIYLSNEILINFVDLALPSK